LQAFGGDDRARLQSKQHAAHGIRTGTDVLFTVKGCVQPSGDASRIRCCVRPLHAC
jgi:hypothetical protein